MKWANPVPMAKAILQREAGPMNWRNPVQVIALVGWKMFRAGSLAARAHGADGGADGPFFARDSHGADDLFRRHRGHNLAFCRPAFSGA